MQSKDIKNFWDWFEANESAFRRRSVPRSLVNDLQSRLVNWGVQDWEIGPFDVSGKVHFFCISKFNPERIDEFLDSLILNAPKIAGWTVTRFRPPKHWIREFYWGDSRRFFSAARWKYTLISYEEGSYSIYLNTNIGEDLGESEKIRIATFVVKSEIGEKLFLEKVFDVLVDDIEGSESKTEILTTDLKAIIR